MAAPTSAGAAPSRRGAEAVPQRRPSHPRAWRGSRDALDQSAGYVTFFDTEGGSAGSRRWTTTTSLARRFATWSRRWPGSEGRWRGGCASGGLYRRGDLDRAAQELDAARQLTSQDELRYLALVFRGMVEAARGHYERADSFYADALRLLPSGQRQPSPRPKRPTFVAEWAKPLPPSRRRYNRRRRTTRGGSTTSGSGGTSSTGSRIRSTSSKRWRWAVVQLVAALSSTAERSAVSILRELVSVDVLVTDGRSPIAGLTAADFELTDNGTPQTIEQSTSSNCRSTSSWSSTAAAASRASGCAR